VQHQVFTTTGFVASFYRAAAGADVIRQGFSELPRIVRNLRLGYC
jgi:hypothetical protein